MSQAERKRLLSEYQKQLTLVQKGSVSKRVKTQVVKPVGEVEHMIMHGPESQLQKISSIIQDHKRKKTLHKLFEQDSIKPAATRMMQFLSPSGIHSVLGSAKTPNKMFHQSIAGAMQSLPTLQFRRTDGILQKISLFHSLRTLNLENKRITNHGVGLLADALPHLTELRVLNLSNTDMFSAPQSLRVGAAVSFLRKLEVLTLTGCRFTKEAIVSLSSSFPNLHKLVELYIDQSEINDEFASDLSKGIAHLVRLRVLDLLPNAIGDTGATDIATAISHLHNLEQVNIGNNVGDNGAVQLSKAFEHHPRLQNILLGNNIGDVGISSLASVFPKLPELRLLSIGNRVTDDGAEVLASALRYTQQIHTLELQNNNLTDRGVKHLCSKSFDRLPELEILDLSDNNIGIVSIRHLIRVAPMIPKLANLDVSGNEGVNGINNDCARLIAENMELFPSLRTLNISRTLINGTGVRAIAIALLPRLDRFVRLTLSRRRLSDRAIGGVKWLLTEDKVVFKP